MAFLLTSDSIVIQATLTEKGKKLLSRGEFRVAKFALGDDEIDYSLFNVDKRESLDPADTPALENSKMLEAYKPRESNIQYGLDSYDDGILYLTSEEIALMAPSTHAAILYLPILKSNNKLTMSPTFSGSFYYLSVNDETTAKLDSIEGFKFLTTSRVENVKCVIESGIDTPRASPTAVTPTRANRKDYLIKKFLLDVDYFVYADNRFISGLCGITPQSVFKNFPSGEKEINFITDRESPPTSYPRSEFDHFATYVTKGIPNHMYHFPEMSAGVPDFASAWAYSTLNGPRGGVLALNPLINQELKGSSTATRDFRYSDYGTINQIVFSELSTSKFDYIETTIYIIGVTSNGRLQIPLRIIRYAGT